MTDYKVGDEVRVFDVNGRRMGQPQGGWVGRIEKIGRTLVHIKYGDARSKTEPFSIGSRYRNDGSGHRYFRTLEQVAQAERKHAAVTVLREHGVDLSHRRSFTTEQVEALAELVKGWDTPDSQGALTKMGETPAPKTITFVIYDEETGGVAVKHDGETVWTENSLGYLDQYFRHYAPLGEPVIIQIEG